MLSGIDISNYSKVIPLEVAQSIKNLGYDFVIIGTQDENICEGQIRTFQLVEGMNIDLYSWIYFDSIRGSQETQKSVTIAHDFKIPRILLDAEDKTDGIPVSDVVNYIRQSRRIVEGSSLQAGIYNRPAWWVQNINTLEFADLPLWYAGDYGKFFKPYGGWVNWTIWQYSSAQNPNPEVFNFSVDFDYAQDNAFEGRIVVQENPIPISTSDTQSTDLVNLALLQARENVIRAMLNGYAIPVPTGNSLEYEWKRIENGQTVSFDPPQYVQIKDV